MLPLSILTDVILAVILFILRSLKVADFPPRIVLVTRTLSTCMSDLVHFAILFFSITVGYSIAGVLLFGHQYEGVSTFRNALVYMVVVLILWDPYQWIQVIPNFQSQQMTCIYFIPCC
jgi:hypothetical protein